MTSRTALPPAPCGPASPPWWRFRIVWLVVGLPATAVVAATLTTVIAVRHADTVVGDQRAHPAHATEPAEQARNHASLPRR